MVYEGRRRGTTAKRRRSEKSAAAGIKLVVCLWVLFLAVMLKLLFPAAVDSFAVTVMEKLGLEESFAAVANLLGETVESGKGVVAALSEGFTTAFGLRDKELPVSADPVGDLSNDEHQTQETPDLADTPDPEGTEPDMVDQFKQSQEPYLDRGIPQNVTFDRPELPFEGAAPVAGTVTSDFGYRLHPTDGEVRFHYGVDLAAGEGESVLAFAQGAVTATGDSTSYGLYVILTHEGGVETLYAHLSAVDVHGGDTVAAGEKLGEAGSTGNATSACVHFEMLIDGTYVNPSYYLAR